MTEEAMFLIIYLVIITLLCILIHVINRGQLSICERQRPGCSARCALKNFLDLIIQGH